MCHPSGYWLPPLQYLRPAGAMLPAELGGFLGDDGAALGRTLAVVAGA
jgi:hypothetical protein